MIDCDRWSQQEHLSLCMVTIQACGVSEAEDKEMRYENFKNKTSQAVVGNLQ